ncbi:YqgE/AlgH family protein [Haliangium sp.]|uniref:YqgE/AlgH family protein n=1 Tax=Haliangium sp. TaxID=2663208 RepID=UPI003D0D9F50
MIETHLAPGLLLAMPHLLDPNFRRAVVLMIEHNDEGSFGLVVNQPLDIDTGELLDSLDVIWQGPAGSKVWRGGPVMPSYGWVLHEPVAGLTPSLEATAEPPSLDALEGGGTISVGPGVSLSSGSLEVLRVIAGAPPNRMRLLLGYAGWGGGQLAHEMAQGAWLHADLSVELVFDTPADQMWERALRSVGIDPENIVHGAGVN